LQIDSPPGSGFPRGTGFAQSGDQRWHGGVAAEDATQPWASRWRDRRRSAHGGDGEAGVRSACRFSRNTRQVRHRDSVMCRALTRPCRRDAICAVRIVLQ